MYAHTRISKPEIACKAVNTSALLAKTNIKDPRLALEIFKLGSMSGCPNSLSQVDSLAFFLKHDCQLAKIISKNWTTKPEEEKRKHLQSLIATIDKYPESNLRGLAMRNVCSIYYWLRDFPNVTKWGNLAILTDPTQQKWEPMQFQLEVAHKHIWKLRTLRICKGIIGLALLILIFQIVRARGKFDYKLLLKKSKFTLPLFFILAITPS